MLGGVALLGGEGKTGRVKEWAEREWRRRLGGGGGVLRYCWWWAPSARVGAKWPRALLIHSDRVL